MGRNPQFRSISAKSIQAAVPWWYIQPNKTTKYYGESSYCKVSPWLRLLVLESLIVGQALSQFGHFNIHRYLSLGPCLFSLVWAQILASKMHCFSWNIKTKFIDTLRIFCGIQSPEAIVVWRQGRLQKTIESSFRRPFCFLCIMILFSAF